MTVLLPDDVAAERAIVGVASSSVIEIVCTAVPSVAPLVAFDRVTVKVSVASSYVSLMIGTVIVFAVASPAAQESVPEVVV